MKEINLYIESIFTGKFDSGTSNYGFTLEYITPEGKAAARSYYGEIPNTTINKALLLITLEALNKLKEPCRVNIVSVSPYLIENIVNENVYEWRINGWTSRGVPVRFKEQWEQLLDLMDIHEVTARKETFYKYRSEMRNHIKGGSDA